MRYYPSWARPRDGHSDGELIYLIHSVRVEYTKRDPYGRVLGIVYAATNGIQNVDINLTRSAALIRVGGF